MPDVFDVLSKDHDQVKEILATLEENKPDRNADARQLARRKKTVEKLITEESKHEAVEEQFFWPAVRERLRNGNKLADRAVAQEDEAKEVLAKLDKLDAGSPEFEKLLGKFIKAGRQHIAFEETKVWPQMREALSDREASEMGRMLRGGKKSAPAKPVTGAAASGPNGHRAAEGKTKAELYEQAKELGVQGRSSMKKEELARQVALAGKS